jgi:hypothetical protein
MADPITQTPPPTPSQGPANAQAQPKSRRWRWTRRLLALLALVLLLAWFAPAIVAKTALRQRIARAASANLNGTLDIGSASFGWFSPVELRDVTLTDKQGRVVARIPKITSSRSLFALATGSGDAGEFAIENPTVEIACEKNTTNLEGVLQHLFEDTAPPSPTRTSVAVRIAGGTLTLRDVATGQNGELRDVNVSVTVPASRTEPVVAKVAANAPGHTEVELSIGESSRVKLMANGFALESLASLLRRAEPGLSLAGSLTADASVTWGKDAMSVEGTLGVKNLALTSPELNGETLRLTSAELPVKVSRAGQSLRIEQADLKCDIGSVSLVGAFDSAESLERVFDKPGVKLDATVDVAKLAAVLPRLLRVRDGTEFREGKLIAKVESKADAEGITWNGNVSTSALRATRAGKDIHWEEPLSIEFAGRVKTGHLPVFDKLTCKSDFIAINAQVQPDIVRAGANVYLDKLAEKLADFVDLGGVTLDGRGSAQLIAQRKPTGEFAINGGVELKQFAFTNSAGKGIREPDLKVKLFATGNAPESGPVSVSTGGITLTDGADQLQLGLLEPVSDAKQLNGGKLDIKLTGELDQWRKRFAVVLPALNDNELSGKAIVSGVVNFGPDAINVDRLTLVITKAHFAGLGLALDEQTVNASTQLRIDRKAKQTTLDKLTLSSAPLSISNGKLAIQAPANGQVVVEGNAQVITDLNRLGKTLGMYVDPAGAAAMRGKGTGSVSFKYAGEAASFASTLDVTDFSYGPQQAPDWSEKHAQLEVDGSYTQSTGVLTFRKAKFDREGLALSATGTLSNVEKTADANLSGTVIYDMAKLTPKLRELLGASFDATGKGSKPVTLAGSLRPQLKPGAKEPQSAFAHLTLELGVGWDSLQVHGFEMGVGELKTNFANGTARVTPISGTFGGGKIMLHPTVNLDPAPGELSFAQELVVDKAKLTPKACAGAVGYVLPALANAAQAEGEVSVILLENHVPLAEARKAKLKGAVVIHKATVSPGPVLGEVATLLGANNVTMTVASEQAVQVRVENGRVYHENLSIKLGNYFVQTSGSVGFDGTLDMVVDMPLPGFKNTPALAKALAGKRVQVPIKGTLNAPKLDQTQFKAAVAKLIQDATREVGKDLLHKELDKLFPGMPNTGTNPGGGLLPTPMPKQ